MITINTYPKIRTAADMIPVTEWLQVNSANSANWKWRVSDEWISGWGHPILVDFACKEEAALFALRWL